MTSSIFLQNAKYIKVSNNRPQHWFDLIECDERSVHFPWNEVMFADVFAEARLREELQGKVSFVEGTHVHDCTSVWKHSVYTELVIQIVQIWMEEKVASKASKLKLRLEISWLP